MPASDKLTVKPEGDGQEEEEKQQAKRPFSLAYILMNVILPQLLNLFLAFDVAKFLDGDGAIRLLCNCYFLAQTAATFPRYVILDNQACIYQNGTTNEFNILRNGGTDPVLSSHADLCNGIASTTKVYSQSVIAVNSACTGVILFVLVPMIYANRKPHVAALVASFLTVGGEYASLAVLLSANSNKENEFMPVQDVFFLQLGVLFSTAFAFFLNLLGEGDAEILDKWEVRKGSCKRYGIMIGMQLTYAISISVNLAALIVFPPKGNINL